MDPKMDPKRNYSGPILVKDKCSQNLTNSSPKLRPNSSLYLSESHQVSPVHSPPRSSPTFTPLSNPPSPTPSTPTTTTGSAFRLRTVSPGTRRNFPRAPSPSLSPHKDQYVFDLDSPTLSNQSLSSEEESPSLRKGLLSCSSTSLVTPSSPVFSTNSASPLRISPAKMRSASPTSDTARRPLSSSQSQAQLVSRSSSPSPEGTGTGIGIGTTSGPGPGPGPGSGITRPGVRVKVRMTSKTKTRAPPMGRYSTLVGSEKSDPVKFGGKSSSSTSMLVRSLSRKDTNGGDFVSTATSVFGSGKSSSFQKVQKQQKSRRARPDMMPGSQRAPQSNRTSDKERKELEKTISKSEDEYVQELLSCVALYLAPIRLQVGNNLANMLFTSISEMAKTHARARQDLDQGNLSAFSSQLNNLLPFYQNFIAEYSQIRFITQALENDSFYAHFIRQLSAPSPVLTTARSVDLKRQVGAPIRRVGQLHGSLIQLSQLAVPQDRNETLKCAESFHQLQQTFVQQCAPPPSSESSSRLEWLTLMNPKCADCSASNAFHISTILGVTLCSTCSTVHMEMAPNVSIVESMAPEILDIATSWVHHPRKEDIFLVVMSSNNTIINAFWEYSLKDGRKPEPESSPELKKHFIHEKYINRAFMNPKYGFLAKVQRSGRRWSDRFLKIEMQKGDPDGSNEHFGYRLALYTSVEATELVQSLILDNGCTASLSQGDPPSAILEFVDSKSDRYLIDCGTRYRCLSLLFALHRVVSSLLDHSPFLLTQCLDKEGWFRAVAGGDLQAIRQYLAKNSDYCLLTDDKRQATGAHIACKARNLEVAMFLLNSGSNFLLPSARGVTAMHEIFSVKWPDSEIVAVDKLLEQFQVYHPNCTFSEETDHGMAPVHLNVMSGGGCLLSFLIKHGADLDKRSSKGATPLMIALRMSDADSALTLIEAGADLFIKTSSGEDVMSAVKDLMDDAVYDAVFLRYESRRISQTQKIIKEIVETEKTYSAQMGILAFFFKVKFKADLSPTPRATFSLFANADAIYESSSNFLVSISKVLDLPPEQQQVGRCFLDHSKYFLSYVPYCINQTICVKTQEVLQNNEQFKKWLEVAQRDSEAKEILDDLLIKPVQRICRHQLLIRELLKYSQENSPDFVALSEVASLLSSILSDANEQKRRLDHICEVFENLGSLGVVFSSESKYLEEGSVKVISERYKEPIDCFYILFSDFFTVVRGKFPKWSPIEVILLSDNPELTRAEDRPSSFDVICREKGRYLRLVMPSDEEREGLFMRLLSIKQVYMNARESSLSSSSSMPSSLESYELQRAIFPEEISIRNSPREQPRKDVAISAKLAKRIGLEEDDEIIQEVGKTSDRKLLRTILERLIDDTIDEPLPHTFEKLHFKSPKWCCFCKKFIYGVFFQANKCKKCQYIAHTRCSSWVGNTCLTPLAMEVWGKREVIEIITLQFQKNNDESRLCTALLFADTIEIVYSVEEPLSSTLGPKKMRTFERVSIDGYLSPPEGDIVILTQLTDTFSFGLGSEEAAHTFLEKISPLLKRSSKSIPSQKLQEEDLQSGDDLDSPPSHGWLHSTVRLADRPQGSPVAFSLASRIRSSLSLFNPDSEGEGEGEGQEAEGEREGETEGEREETEGRGSGEREGESEGSAERLEREVEVVERVKGEEEEGEKKSEGESEKEREAEKGERRRKGERNTEKGEGKRKGERSKGKKSRKKTEGQGKGGGMRESKEERKGGEEGSGEEERKEKEEEKEGEEEKEERKGEEERKEKKEEKTPKQITQQSKKGVIVEVNCDFKGESETELSLFVGESLVVEDMGGDWWYGHKRDDPAQSGWFPSDFVDVPS